MDDVSYNRLKKLCIIFFIIATVVGISKNIKDRGVVSDGTTLQIWIYYIELIIQKVSNGIGLRGAKTEDIKWLAVSSIMATISVILSLFLKLSGLNISTITLQAIVLILTVLLTYHVKKRQTYNSV
ncbi:hypothetical protein HDE_13186 [Halotydeus destructor]|nr:hypothetical protein HDE_13186 [Halotydeus destructor]